MMSKPSQPLPKHSPRRLEAALRYAANGWPVGPCHRSKAPMNPPCPRGLYDFTTFEPTIRKWSKFWFAAAIGVHCGRAGIVVADYDPANDLDGMSWHLLDQLLDGVHTARSRTGSGGLHYFFREPQDVVIRNSAGGLGPGLDIRAGRGYVIVPPSWNRSGQYRWLVEADGSVAPIAEMPSRLREAVTTQRPQRSRSGLMQSAPLPSGPIHEGQRNDALTRLAGSFRRAGMLRAELESALLELNADRMVPPLPEAEVMAVALSVSRYASAVPRLRVSNTPLRVREVENG